MRHERRLNLDLLGSQIHDRRLPNAHLRIGISVVVAGRHVDGIARAAQPAKLLLATDVA